MASYDQLSMFQLFSFILAVLVLGTYGIRRSILNDEKTTIARDAVLSVVFSVAIGVSTLHFLGISHEGGLLTETLLQVVAICYTAITIALMALSHGDDVVSTRNNTAAKAK